MLSSEYFVKGKREVIPVKDKKSPEGSRSLMLQGFKTIGT
jgi:hypothetical protein